MIYYKMILIVITMVAITLGAASESSINTELDHGWQFSMNLKYVSIEKNKSIDQNGKEVRNFIIKSDRNQTEKAVIIPISNTKLETFNNLSMSSYIDKEMKYRNLSKLSARP